MVSCGNHLFGSQFFITLGENLDSLDNEHLVFGEIVEGLEVVNKLNQCLTDEGNRPFQDIRITHMVVLEDPYPDPDALPAEPPSPELTKEVLKSDYIAADEVIDDTEGKTSEEIAEEIADRDAKARATILEMVGDLPDADTAPPENILFVCKLNPVTTSEDLEIIFSRFGKINSCEVICDHVTGNSLQYAFIKFAVQKSCEDAYFKMDNVLIDDRRIHVDFSQSVSKFRWKGKGKGVEVRNDLEDVSRVEGFKKDAVRKNVGQKFDRRENRRMSPRRSRSRERNRDRYYDHSSRDRDRYTNHKEGRYNRPAERRRDHYSDAKGMPLMIGREDDPGLETMLTQ